MKTNSKDTLKVIVFLLAFATCSLAQTSATYNTRTSPEPGAPGSAPQTAAPGIVNYVEGQVSVDGRALNAQSFEHIALRTGQSLETGNGYAEVLLTPGAFLRLGPNSEFRMTSVGLADTRITLVRGDALVEADQVIAGTHLEVTLASTSVDMLKKGLYGFAADPADIKVFDGKADVVGLAKSRVIGKHDQILLADNAGLKKAGFDENQAKGGQLYVWSEARSRQEAAQNQLVARNPGGYAPVGFGWFWNPYVNYYGFWPSAYLYSPLGFGLYGGVYPGFYGGYYGGSLLS